MCEHLLDISKGEGSCFSYKLGVCKGACIGRELFLKYNLRFLEAFSKTKLRRWPFDGAIAIVEESIMGNKEYFIIDNWCFLGSKKQFDDKIISQDYSFDYDIYKIISRYVFSENPSGIIPIETLYPTPGVER